MNRIADAGVRVRNEHKFESIFLQVHKEWLQLELGGVLVTNSFWLSELHPHLCHARSEHLDEVTEKKNYK